MDARPDSYSIPEAARILNLSEDAVRKRIKRGVLPATKVDGMWRIILDTSQTVPMTAPGQHLDDAQRLLSRLEDEVVFLRSQLHEQLTARDQQLAEKDQQISVKDEQLARKDEQIGRLLEDIESWREQVRYKELQIAQLQDRLFAVPSAVEDVSTEQGSTQPAQAEESRNALSRFWHWVIGK
jgi:excisionase family DNA binding protein